MKLRSRMSSEGSGRSMPPWMLGPLGVACVVALVAVYLLTPTPDCATCGPVSTGAPIGSVLGIQYSGGESTSLVHRYNFTVRWVNESVPIAAVDLQVETLGGGVLGGNTSWTVSAIPPGLSSPVDVYAWPEDDSGWTYHTPDRIVVGEVFSLDSGPSALGGDWLRVVGNTLNPTGSLRVAIP